MRSRMLLALASSARPAAGQENWRGALGGGLIGGVLFLALVGAMSIGRPSRATPMRDDPRAWANVRLRPYIFAMSIVCFGIAAAGAAVHWL